MSRFACLLGITVGLVACGRTAPDDSRRRPAPTKDPLEVVADEAATRKVADGDTVGVTVGVARRGKIMFVKGYGHADRDAHVTATADTVYRIGGITEEFTAAAIMRLVEQHKLGLDDDVTKYVAVPTRGRTVTIRQLLRHASGMPEYRFEGRGSWAPGKVSPTQILDRIKDRPWDEDRRSAAEYVVLGLVIEKVTGEPYARFLEREVIARARLEHTAPCDTVQGIAQTYLLYKDGARPVPAVDPSVELAAGSLCSTVPDILAWSAALSSGQVVSAASYKAMTTPDHSADGMGLSINTAYARRHIDASGLSGHAVILSEYPDDGLAIAVMANTSGVSESRIERALAMAAFGIPSKEVPLPPELRDSFVGTYRFPNGGDTVVGRWRGKLTIRVAAGVPMELEYQGNDTFAALDSSFTVVFHRDGGVVTGFTTDQPPELGGTVDAVRVSSPPAAGSASDRRAP